MVSSSRACEDPYGASRSSRRGARFAFGICASALALTAIALVLSVVRSPDPAPPEAPVVAEGEPNGEVVAAAAAAATPAPPE